MKKTKLLVMTCAWAVATAATLMGDVQAGRRYARYVYLKNWAVTPRAEDKERTENRRRLIERYRKEIDAQAMAAADEIRKKSESHSNWRNLWRNGETVEYGYAIYYDPQTGKIKATAISGGGADIYKAHAAWNPTAVFKAVADQGGVVLAINHSHPEGVPKADLFRLLPWKKEPRARTQLPFSGVETLENGADIGAAVGYGILFYVTGYDGSLAVFDPYKGDVGWLEAGNLKADIQKAVDDETKQRLTAWYAAKGSTAKLGIGKIPGERFLPTKRQGSGSTVTQQKTGTAQSNREAQLRAQQEANTRTGLQDGDINQQPRQRFGDLDYQQPKKHQNLFGDTLR